MYTREESSRIKQEFWTTFGRYMSPVPSADGSKVNWINYHTRVRDVHFRMNADAREASISITLEHRDAGMQELFFEQFAEFKNILHTEVGEEWKWSLHEHDSSGRLISRIYTTLPDVSIYNKEQWPELISFFKPRLVALDSFWENARYSFESLQ